MSKQINDTYTLDLAVIRRAMLAIEGPTVRIIGIFLLLALLGAKPLYGQAASEQPLQGVFRTELVYTQGRGEVQLTAGFSSSWNQNTLLSWPLQVEYGITSSWQVQFNSDGWQRRIQTGHRTVSGINEGSLGTKYSFMHIDGSPFHAAALFDIRLPFRGANQDPSEGFQGYEPSFMLARDFPGYRDLQLFMQAGFLFVPGTRYQAPPANRQVSQFRWSGGFFCPFRHVVVTTELSAETNLSNRTGRDNELYLTPGTVWKLPAKWELGVGISAGLTAASTPIAMQVMFTRDFRFSEKAY